jgi:hypothetical protein
MKWISITDRLPPECTHLMNYDYVLALMSQKEDWFLGFDGFLYDIVIRKDDPETGRPRYFSHNGKMVGDITHWMLLPDPPQGIK